ncbi:MAG: protein kinase, partial [Bacteroidota bacterium]|nr:protein kinase [Bacteroidota bacterium]
IFHRDIKPSNLILTPEGTVKLMDFGIARIAGEQRLTQVNRVIGTMEFMAPELIEGKEPSAASDIYATGITMYELLSGRLPFESQSDYLLMQDIMKKKPLHLSTVNPSVPPGLAGIIMQALEKKPENRFLSARAFQQALIQAFPDCRDADLATLTIAVNDPLATKEASATAMMPTQLGSIVSEKATVLQQLDRNILRSRKLPFVLAGIGVFLFLGILFAVTRSRDNKEIAAPIRKDTVVSIAASPTPPALITTQSVPVQTSTPIITPVTADESNSNLQPKREKRPAEKEKPQKMATVAKPVEPEPKKEPDPLPVVKKAEPKEITLREKLEVELSMRETITREEDEREQPVSFTVSSPVVYNGVTIVNRGAVARGSIKIGRVLSTVDISSVEAANGRQIALKGRAHRKVKDLSSERSYTAVLVKGTTLLF